MSSCSSPGASESDIPQPDYCETLRFEGLESVEVGIAAPTGDFQPLADGDIVPMTMGGQGLNMVELRYRFAGGTTECIDRTAAFAIPDGPGLYTDTRRLKAYPDQEGGFVSNSDFVLFGPRDKYLELTVSAGDDEDVVRVWVDDVYAGPGLLAPQLPKSSIEVGERMDVTLALDAPSPERTEVLYYSDSDTVSYLGLHIGEGQSETTLEIRGQSEGRATIYVGVGDVYYTLELDVIGASP